MKPATNDDLKRILIRYEGAVSTVERDGDDSETSMTELENARSELMDVLRQARVNLP